MRGERRAALALFKPVDGGRLMGDPALLQRFGAPTAKTIAARGVDKWTVRAGARSGSLAVDNAGALPTARASAHLPTALHHDDQGTLPRELMVLHLEIQGVLFTGKRP
jgi:hypothetical protein